MLLIAFTLILGIVIGLALGGSLREFPTIRLRSWWLAALGIGMQLPNPPGVWGHLLVIASFIVLLAFALDNVEQPGVLLIGAGLLLNALAITVNGGMPISREAIVRSGQEATLPDLMAGGGAKHHLADEETRLLLLGDVIAVPPPIAQAMSVGDLVMYGGVVWYLAAATGPRLRARNARRLQLTSRARNARSASRTSTSA